MKRIALLVVGIFAFCGVAHANTFDLSLGAKFRSNLYERGATYYNSWQVSPVIYVALFDHTIQSLGNNLIFTTDLVEKKWTLWAEMKRRSDAPLYETGGRSKEGITNSRPDTWEFSLLNEFHFEGCGRLNFLIAQDLQAHNGQYFELRPFINLPKLSGLGSFLESVQLELMAAIGYGSQNHNVFQFGNTVTGGGFTHWEAGLNVSWPGRYHTVYPLAQIFYYSALGSENRAGALLGGKENGVQVNFTAAFGILGL